MEELEQRVGSSRSKVDRWARVSAVSQFSEAADTPAESGAKWAKVYREFSATGESAQDEVFAAVNMYLLKNGCSPAGKYRKPIRTAGGQEVSAGALTKITGKLEGDIRQFMRGRMEDTYMFLKHNAAIVQDEELTTRAETLGVPKNYAWLLADWLGENCPYFQGDEGEMYRKLRASVIAVANTRRANAIPVKDRVLEDDPDSRSLQAGLTSNNTGGNGYSQKLY